MELIKKHTSHKACSLCNGHTMAYGIFIFLFCLTLSSCEEEFIPTNINLDPELVVEGYIESGDNPMPAYVLLTRSRPFFTTLSTNQLEDLFIRKAEVKVIDGVNEVLLNEVCIHELPPLQRKRLAEQLGLNPDSVQVNICVYIDQLGSIIPVEGKTYKLRIQAEGQTIEASTMIPLYVPLDTTWWRDAPGQAADTLLQLMTRINEPIGKKNFYRYFCSINGSNFVTPFNSVFDDALIDGKDFEFRLIRPNLPGEKFDQSTFGLFHVGDSITVKWASIDQSHFDFWNTLEFNKGNQGPFSSYTTINSNIKGGLGIWGGYSTRNYKLKVKK